MSIETDQQKIPDLLAPERHLTIELDTRSSSNYSANPDRGEWYCRECHARVTVSSTSRKEYGHQTDCGKHLNVGAEQ